ncbi:FUSC family protein [Streptomyces sp. NPDC050560]|uniref:FUSC family protein n=1 Tax=Streptomyces sp. NPDC050560 TaxID=3365630 RepID=UPI00379FA2F5
MTARVRGRLSELRDRVIGSDPGLNRLRQAVSAGVAMAGAMAVEYGFAHATRADAQGTMVAMMLGTIIAMMGSMALAVSGVWLKIRTAVFFPVAIGLGLVLGVTVAGSTATMLGVFVVVMFAAVFVRRFGPAFFFYGFMAWMGYFFAAFLHPTMDQLPSLVAAVGVGTAWVLLLSLTVLRTNPRRTLRRIQAAFGARSRAVARTCADLLTAEDDARRARLRRRLHARQLRLAETALMIEGWSAEPGALPVGWSGPALRRRLLDAQLAVDALALAADSLAAAGGSTVSVAARIADHLARREYDAVRRTAAPLLRLALAGPGTGTAAGHAAPASAPRPVTALAGRGAPAHGPVAAGRGAAVPEPVVAGGPHMSAHQVAAAAVEYVDLAAQAGTPPETDAAEDSYEPAVTLAMGNLPGSFAVAKDVAARGGRWNPLSRSGLVTRQAVQAAVAGGIAIVIGRAISEQRYYWAVIAAFIAFTGTATRSETFIKASNRVIGTLVGLFAGVGLAHVTAGHTLTVLGVIVASMACGFYLVQISYAYMIFFVTIMVSQLYVVLNEFSTELLVLRLEETAAGAAVGIVVALVMLPTYTRDAVGSARSEFFATLQALLTRVAVHLEGPAAVPVTGPRATAAAAAGSAPGAVRAGGAGARGAQGGGAAGAGTAWADSPWANDPWVSTAALDGTAALNGPALDGVPLDKPRPDGLDALDGLNRMDDLDGVDGAGLDTLGAEEEPERDLDALARALDHQLRGLALVARPLTRPLSWGNDPRLVRHRLTLYAAAARQARAAALAPRRVPAGCGEAVGPASAARELAAAAGDIGAHWNRSAQPPSSVRRRLAAAETALMADPPCRSAPPSALTLPLVHLRQLLMELATPQAPPTRAAHARVTPRVP